MWSAGHTEAAPSRSRLRDPCCCIPASGVEPPRHPSLPSCGLGPSPGQRGFLFLPQWHRDLIRPSVLGLGALPLPGPFSLWAAARPLQTPSPNLCSLQGSCISHWPTLRTGPEFCLSPSHSHGVLSLPESACISLDFGLPLPRDLALRWAQENGEVHGLCGALCEVGSRSSQLLCSEWKLKVTVPKVALNHTTLKLKINTTGQWHLPSGVQGT